MGGGVDEDVCEISRLGGHPVGGFGSIKHGMVDAWVSPGDIQWKIERGKGGGEDVAEGSGGGVCGVVVGGLIFFFFFLIAYSTQYYT